MYKWFLVLLTVGTIACTDSTPESALTQVSNEAKQVEANVDETTANQSEEAQTATGTDTSADESESTSVVTEEIEYTVDDQPFTGFLAYDAGIEGERPGVLVVHEWWGHNDYARSRAIKLAEMGYTAFALDMYGAGKVTDHPDDAQKFMAEATQHFDQAKARFLRAKALLEQTPSTNPEKIAAIGYCFGGGVVINMAKAGVDLDGVASFHGSLASMVSPKPDTVTAQILVLNGADDPFVTNEQIMDFISEMETAQANYEFINYPGATHGFTNPGATEAGEKFDMPLAYNKDADEQSWGKLNQFLETLWNEQ